MKNKLIKFIVNFVISGLVCVLMITSIFAYKSHTTKTLTQVPQTQISQQVQQFRVISSKDVIDHLNKENSLNVFSGEIGATKTFTNKDIPSDDVNMNWINKWFENHSSKEITYNNRYKFLFAYDLSTPKVTCNDGVINIQISPNKLSLISIEQLNQASSEKVKLFESNFQPYQRDALNMRVKELTRNTIMSDQDYRAEAIENTKDKLRENLKAFLGDDIKVNFTETTYDVVQQNDVSLNS